MRKGIIIVAVIALGLMSGCGDSGKTDIKAADGSLAETPKPGESVGAPKGEK
jgi:major membrane immunogen (membrane-anchored lipoprotein)